MRLNRGISNTAAISASFGSAWDSPSYTLTYTMGSATRSAITAESRSPPSQISRITEKAATGTALQKVISGDKSRSANRHRKAAAASRLPPATALKKPQRIRITDPRMLCQNFAETIPLHRATAVSAGPANKRRLSATSAATCQTPSQKHAASTLSIHFFLFLCALFFMHLS